MPVHSDNDTSRLYVEVEARGSDLEEVRKDALKQAAAFFGVRADESTLTLTGGTAIPTMTTSTGRPTLYRMSTKVYMAPAAVPDTPSRLPAGPPEHVGDVAVPSRRTSRPVGPSGQEFEFDDDDLDDEAEGVE